MPLFPLPEVWLFPLTVLPLHVFEPRYRALVEDTLDGPGRIVLGTVAAGHEEELAGTPPFDPIAGLGEIGRHERLPDGDYRVWLVGLGRVRIQEVGSDRPYRRVAIRPVEEIEVPRERERPLRKRLEAALRRRAEGEDPPPAGLPIARLADFLALRVRLPPETMREVFQELDLERRARRVLDYAEDAST